MGVPGDFQTLQCENCGLWMVSPRPDGDELLQYYPADYAPYNTMPSGPTGMRAVLRQQFFLRPLFAARDAMREFFDNNRLPRPIKTALRQSGARLVDVGCGSGVFLDQMRQTYGCEVMGVDFSPNAAQFAQDHFQIPVRLGPFTQMDFEPNSLDVVTAWWYVEHDPDPKAVFAKAMEILKPGGWLVFAVPNHASLVARLFGNRWYHLEAPRHIHLFSPSTLRRYLKEAGYSPVSLGFDRTPWGLLGSLEYLLRKKEHGPVSWPWRQPQRALLSPFTLLLATLGISDTMVAYAQKPLD